ncbi:MAG: RNA polymerase sigma factor [Sphingobium sp.]
MASEREWILGVVRRYERPLLAYVRTFLGSEDRSRDVVQEAFLRLCRLSHRRRVAMEPRLAPWLFAVCRSRAVDVLRKEKRSAAAPEVVELMVSTEYEPPDAAELHDSSRAVAEQLATLPREQAEAVRLKFAQGFSYREIAGVMGLTESHVGVLLHRALKSLRASLPHLA